MDTYEENFKNNSVRVFYALIMVNSKVKTFVYRLIIELNSQSQKLI